MHTQSFNESALSEALAMLSQDLAMKAAIVAAVRKGCARQSANRRELLAFGAAWAERPYVDDEKLGMALAIDEDS